MGVPPPMQFSSFICENEGWGCLQTPPRDDGVLYKPCRLTVLSIILGLKTEIGFKIIILCTLSIGLTVMSSINSLYFQNFKV